MIVMLGLWLLCYCRHTSVSITCKHMIITARLPLKRLKLNYLQVLSDGLYVFVIKAKPRRKDGRQMSIIHSRYSAFSKLATSIIKALQCRSWIVYTVYFCRLQWETGRLSCLIICLAVLVHFRTRAVPWVARYISTPHFVWNLGLIFCVYFIV